MCNCSSVFSNNSTYYPKSLHIICKTQRILSLNLISWLFIYITAYFSSAKKMQFVLVFNRRLTAVRLYINCAHDL